MKKSKTILLRSAALAILLQTGAMAETFTSCAAIGAYGPDQTACDTAYTGTDLEGSVTVVSGVQNWTVPTTGTYHIQAVGAQGASSDPAYVGGHGAEIAGDFDLTAGTTLQIVVGQQGVGQSGDNNGGGGGGSFVVDASNVPLIVAGGGGGTRTSVLQNGCDASVTEYGIIGSEDNQTSPCTVKDTDLGLGGIVSSNSWGSGGAGFNGDGATDGSGGGDGGSSWANGMFGGEATATPLAHGGFGGGGTGNGSYGGGGGGGYSGGDGGRVAGGGGSYNSGSNPSAAVTANTGDGTVIITLLQAPVSVPLSASAKALMAVLFASLSLVFFRKRRFTA